MHFLRRVHQSPSPQKLKALTEFVAELGYKTESLQSRFELQKLLAAVAGRPEQHAVNFAVLRSLQRAIYSPKEEGHYALASDCYCHFTSPIRRYPDLTVHRLVDAILTKTQAAQRLRRAGRAGPALLRPRAAGRGGRTRPDEAQAAGLPERPDRRGDGRRGDRRGELRPVRARASSCRPKGWSASRRLRDDYYRFDRATHTLAGHRAGNSYRLGDLLRVAVARVDLERREMDFRVVERAKSKPARSTKDTKSTKKGKAEKKQAVPRQRQRPSGVDSRASSMRRLRPSQASMRLRHSRRFLTPWPTAAGC